MINIGLGIAAGCSVLAGAYLNVNGQSAIGLYVFSGLCILLMESNK